MELFIAMGTGLARKLWVHLHIFKYITCLKVFHWEIFHIPLIICTTSGASRKDQLQTQVSVSLYAEEVNNAMVVGKVLHIKL